MFKNHLVFDETVTSVFPLKNGDHVPSSIVHYRLEASKINNSHVRFEYFAYDVRKEKYYYKVMQDQRGFFRFKDAKIFFGAMKHIPLPRK